jgi:hypothetical protein
VYYVCLRHQRLYKPAGLKQRSQNGRWLCALERIAAFVVRWWFGAHTLNLLKHNILCFICAHPVRSAIYGNFEGAGPQGRLRWLKEVERLGRHAA